MKKLLVAGEVYEAEQIIKTENDVIGYTNGHEVFKFGGIRNMEAYSLANGAAWDVKDLSMAEELALYKERLSAAENALMGLMEMNMGGGI